MHQRVAVLVVLGLSRLGGDARALLSLFFNCQITQAFVTVGLGAFTQRLAGKTLVDDLLAFSGEALLQGQLGHFHEVLGLVEHTGTQLQAHHVQPQAVAETALAC